MKRTRALDGYRTNMVESVASGLYNVNDSDPLVRRVSGEIDDSVWVGAPTHPAVPITNAFYKRYDMVDARDLDTTNVWQGFESNAGGEQVRFDTDTNHSSVELYTDTADQDYTFLQTRNALCGLRAGKKMWFEAEIKIRDDIPGADSEVNNYFMGLCDLMAGGETPFTSNVDGSNDKTDWIGFQTLPVASPGLGTRVSVGINGTEVGSAGGASTVISHGEWHTLSFKWDGVANIDFFIDGNWAPGFSLSPSEVAALAAEPLYFTFGVKTNEAKQKSLLINRIQILQE